MDPALREFLRGSVAEDREVEAVIRLDRPDADIVGVRIVSRFGPIATCRLRKDSILDVRRNDHVLSLKAARALGPEHEKQDGGTAREPSLYDGDKRRPPGLPLTGAGVTIGFVDWGCDFDHPNFKRDDGATRLLAVWDQRGPTARDSPQPYGYGTEHGQQQINRALRTADPYAALGYHPGDADRGVSGAHGTHVMDIAAGNGLAGGPSGIAPEADLVFVHLADRGTSGLANLGDSVRILEAVDFIARIAGSRPWVINISVGRHGGPHDGCTLAELALDSLLKEVPGRIIVQSAGNYFDARTHASGLLEAGQVRSLTMMTMEADVTPNELEVWYSGEDELAVQVASPTGHQTRWIPLSRQADVLEEDRVVGRIYHRDCDPNNHDNHIELFLDPWAPAGPWCVSLRAIRVRHGVFHAWIERDDACADCQARFIEDDADSACTTGTIANAHLPLVVGAYDAHSPTRAVAEFSSAGPTRDGRSRPDLVAPGMQILAARSAPPGSVSSLGLLTRKSGTSMATPHVTGAAALCLQGAPYPLAAKEIRELLLRTAGPLTGAGPSSRYGHGYLDVASATAAASALGRRFTLRRPNGAARARGPRRNSKETNMAPEHNQTIPAYLSPDTLYRELLYRPDGQTSAWIGDTFAVIARPGESPVTQPAAGDVLVRVALGEPGLGHVAVLSDSGLRPRGSLDQTYLQAEHGGPGLYAIVNEHSTYPRAHSDRVARRVLDHTGHMPPGQVLLRPKPPLLPDLDLPGTVILETAKTDVPYRGEGEAGVRYTGGLPDETDGGETDGCGAPADDLEGASIMSEGLEDFRGQEDYDAFGELEESEELEGQDIREGDSMLGDNAESPVSPAPHSARRPLTTPQLRDAWVEYVRAERGMVTIPLLSNPTPVNPVAVEAFTALADALRTTGYHAHRAWVYNCRDIAQADSGHPPRASLHAFGLAVDIDPDWNPHCHDVSAPILFSSRPSQGGRQQEVAAGVAGTAFTPQQVTAVEAIRTVDGLQVFGWGGRWRSSHDAMHFEIRLTPAELRRGIAPHSAPDGEAETASEQVTCGACEADAEAEADEITGESDEAAVREDDSGRSRWGLYDQIPLGTGVEAGHD